MKKETNISRFKEIDIYPVTCEKLSAGRSNIEILNAVVEGGAKIIQLREKDYSKKELYTLAVIFREITSRANVLLIINDHLDIALAVEADGIHLGQDDLPIAVARKLAPELLIGASTHSLQQALKAQEDGADYVNIGPIFPTKTKDGVVEYLGPEAISTISPHLTVPFTVMGGINENNMDQVITHGARRLAMVTAITQAPDIAATVRHFRNKINKTSLYK